LPEVLALVGFMCAKTRLKIIAAISAGVVLAILGLRLADSDSHIKIASSITRQDIRAIRSEIARKRWVEVRKIILAHDFRRMWHFALPVLFSRVESIAGFPGPPGGAHVECRGMLADTESCFMVFNNTNGWKCDRMEFIDSSTMRQIRESQKQLAAEP
jgi:hypothetical protein